MPVPAPPGYDWLADAKERATVPEVAEALGMEVRTRGGRPSLAPCPVCGDDQRGHSTRDRRGPVGLTPDLQGWRCFRCDASGSVFDLAGHLLLGRLPHGRDDFAALRAWFADRGWCYGNEQKPRQPATPRPHLRKPPQRLPERPARTPELVDDVATLWTRHCRPVTEDPEVRAWLERRGLDPAKVEDRDLARALPKGLTDLPPWAWARGRPWSAGWRCVLPAYGPDGRLESLRARWVRPGDPPRGLKAVAAAAGAGSASGVVLADPLGLELLRTGEAPPTGQRLRVVVVEGGPDFLTWATRWSEADLTAPAVFGVWPGAWTRDIGARVPSGAQVALRTHEDKAGLRYAWLEVWPTLTGRCDVVRPDLPDGRDDNDLLRAGELPFDPFEDWHGTDQAAAGA